MPKNPNVNFITNYHKGHNTSIYTDFYIERSNYITILDLIFQIKLRILSNF